MGLHEQKEYQVPQIKRTAAKAYEELYKIEENHWERPFIAHIWIFECSYKLIIPHYELGFLIYSLISNIMCDGNLNIQWLTDDSVGLVVSNLKTFFLMSHMSFAETTEVIFFPVVLAEVQIKCAFTKYTLLLTDLEISD